MSRDQWEQERREALEALASAPRFRYPDPWIESEYVEAGHLRAALAREAELEQLATEYAAELNRLSIREAEWQAVLPQPTLWEECEVERLLRLEAGWDSYGAKAPDQDTIEAAFVFIRPLPRPHVVVPLCSGGVQFEWCVGGMEIEMACEPKEQCRTER